MERRLGTRTRFDAAITRWEEAFAGLNCKRVLAWLNWRPILLFAAAALLAWHLKQSSYSLAAFWTILPAALIPASCATAPEEWLPTEGVAVVL